MKALIWIIIALVFVGGIVWFLSSDVAESSNALYEESNTADQLSENGRVNILVERSLANLLLLRKERR